MQHVLGGWHHPLSSCMDGGKVTQVRWKETPNQKENGNNRITSKIKHDERDIVESRESIPIFK